MALHGFIEEFNVRAEKLSALKETFIKASDDPLVQQAFDHSLRIWKEPGLTLGWWIRQSRHFEDQSPLEYLAADPKGRIERITNHLGQIEYGVYL